MPLEDIDDLFRNQLAGHETPPNEALWTRLNAAAADEPTTDPAAERLDQLFQKGLNAHATPAGREIWERLEDEHLRPRKRRGPAWWPLALAAAVALLLVAGGAGLWLGLPWGTTTSNTVARQGNQQPGNHQEKAAAGPKQSAAKMPIVNGSTAAAAAPPVSPTMTAAAGPTNAASAAPSNQQPVTSNQKLLFPISRATRADLLASTAPKTSRAASGPSLRHSLGAVRQPDAAADHRPLVSRTTTQAAQHPAPGRPTAADEQRPAVAVVPTPVPAPEIVPAVPIPASSPTMAMASELITVDVRNGGNGLAGQPAKTTTTALAVTVADAPDERRGLGGRLLRQAGHLVRGERVSLAEVTGLPENLTLRATVAGRSVSKSIQL